MKNLKTKSTVPRISKVALIGKIASLVLQVDVGSLAKLHIISTYNTSIELKLTIGPRSGSARIIFQQLCCALYFLYPSMSAFSSS